MTFTDLSSNKSNSLRIISPIPPIKPVCIITDRVCSSCQKTGIITGHWSYYSNENDRPTPFPPEKIVKFFLDAPVITELHTYYSPSSNGFYISALYSFNITAIYLDRQMNRGKIVLSHKGEENAWLKSPPGKESAAEIYGKVLSYELKDKTVLNYFIKVKFDFLVIDRVKLLVPSFGPCPLPRYVID